MAKKDRIVISVGGSLIVTKTGIDTDFLTSLNSFVRKQLAQYPNRQIFLVVGGGTTARHYRDAGRTVVHHELTGEDLDWIGIHATRLNAHLLRTIFRDIAHPYLIKDYSIIRKATEKVVIAAGWKPGWSTDYCALLVCEDYDVTSVINISNISQVYDKDPSVHADAQPIDTMNWKEFRALVGDTWVPGMHAPFDPIAAKKAQKLKVKVVVMGSDFANLEKYLSGEDFVGTIIQ